MLGELSLGQEDILVDLQTGHLTVAYDRTADRIYVSVDGTSRWYCFVGSALDAWLAVFKRAAEMRAANPHLLDLLNALIGEPAGARAGTALHAHADGRQDTKGDTPWSAS